MTDAQIITCLRNNQYAAALRGLYGVLPSVKQLIRAGKGNSEDAKDLFQDALVVLYKKAQQPDFTLTVPLKTYLLAIVKNCWRAELRRRNQLPAADVPDELPDAVPDREPGFELARTAFQLLGSKCRELLILFYFKKKSLKEIAREFSFRDERVAKNQKYRCMEKARENYLILSKTGEHGY